MSDNLTSDQMTFRYFNPNKILHCILFFFNSKITKITIHEIAFYFFNSIFSDNNIPDISMDKGQNTPGQGTTINIPMINSILLTPIQIIKPTLIVFVILSSPVPLILLFALWTTSAFPLPIPSIHTYIP